MSTVLFVLYILISSYDLVYLADLRIKAKKEIVNILLDNDYVIEKEKEEKLISNLDFYLKYKFKDYNDLISLSMASILPIINLSLLYQIITKDIKYQFDDMKNYCLDERFIKNAQIYKNTKKERTKSYYLSEHYDLTPRIDKIKKRVLKKKH